jgi:IclR family acetate operon transcriptional repressor
VRVIEQWLVRNTIHRPDLTDHGKPRMNPPTNSLERALTLLEIVAHRPDGCTNSELSHKLAIPTSSCSYVLARLTRERYLSRGPDGRYTIGLKTLILAHAALRRVGFRPFAEPVLYKLVEETHLAANIGVLEGGRVLLVDRVESPESVSAAVQLPRELRDIGIDLPVHTTGLGKALLAGLDRTQVLGIVEDQGLAGKTKRTIASTGELFAELQLVRERGYATVRDEHYVGFWSIAAPILDADGTTRAAVSLTGDPDQPAWRDPDALAIRLNEAARDISRSMRLR